MKLLARDKLIRTGPVDYADWNYRPVLGSIQRLRFSLALSLLPKRSTRLLEIGYGSGVFMPALASIATEVYGIDPHEKTADVLSAFEDTGIRPKLFQAPAEALPFDNDMFDGVVAVSSLEFVSDLDKTCGEIKRVLKPTGVFVVVTPGHSPVLDFGLKILTGNSAKRDFGGRRQAIIPTLLNHFVLDRRRTAPPLGGSLFSLYSALRLKKPATAGQDQSR